ncbi:Homeobox-leucine zipper protein ATHB-23 [Zea mays]|uniref:Homeobox-leucine zipper protein ATHB-23 n=1 Tax=Zea mays TaxID=4577 RepID=A0A1D6PJ71_MAIZE|nr:Homeobox-leucine zipper protein ATHB-23 [Zea mays]
MAWRPHSRPSSLQTSSSKCSRRPPIMTPKNTTTFLLLPFIFTTTPSSPPLNAPPCKTSEVWRQCCGSARRCTAARTTSASEARRRAAARRTRTRCRTTAPCRPSGPGRRSGGLIPFYPSVGGRHSIAAGVGMDQLLHASTPKLEQHGDGCAVAVQAAETAGSFGNLLCGVDETPPFWPWADHHHFH